MLSGHSKIEITPSFPVFLAGYGSRRDKSAGINDPLFASTLYLADSTTKWLLINLDLVAIGSDLTQRIRKQLEETTGIPSENITLACTHTHSGPAGISRGFPFENSVNNNLQNEISNQILSGALEAISNVQPVEIRFGHTHVSNIGLNRNNPAKRIDNELQVIEFLYTGGKRVVVTNYGCHPTILSAKNLLISADLYGATRKILEQKNKGSLFLFTNSGAGDVSTRFTRRGEGFEELQRFGKEFADSIEECLEKTSSLNASSMNIMSAKVELPIRKFPNPDAAQKMLNEANEEWDSLKKNNAEPGKVRAAETKVFGASTQLKYSNLPSFGPLIEGEVQIIGIGKLIFFTLPGEPYNKIVFKIKASFPQNHVVVISYANDYMGYFPLTEGADEETYETLKSPYLQNIGDEIINQSIQILNNFIEKNYV